MTTLIRRVTAVMLVSGAATHMAALRQNPIVVFETEKGAIEVDVDTRHAPVTAANFLRYVDGGFYAGGSVNRAVRPRARPTADPLLHIARYPPPSRTTRRAWTSCTSRTVRGAASALGVRSSTDAA